MERSVRSSEAYPTFERITRTRLFWIAVIIISATLAFISSQLNMPYLGFPQTLLMIASFPLVGIIALSVRVGAIYVRVHKWFSRKREMRYYKTDAFPFIFPKIRSMLMTSVLNVIGMAYLVVSSVPFIDYSQVSGFVALLLLFFVFLMVVPALNVSTIILRRSGVMYENPKDGTRMNLGVDLANKLRWAIGPLALVRLVHLEISSFPNVGAGFLVLLMTIAVAIPALTLTFFLSKQHLPRLSARLDNELSKIL